MATTIDGINLTSVDLLCSIYYTLDTTIKSLDGIQLQNGHVVLFTELTDPTQNGIYTANISNNVLSWSRTTSFNTSADFLSGLYITVADGKINCDSTYFLEPNPTFVLGYSVLHCVQVKTSAILLKTLSDISGSSGGGSITGTIGIDSAHNTVNIRQTVTTTNRSGTIAAGGVAQTLMASNTNRKGFIIQNTSTQYPLYFEIGGTASTLTAFLDIGQAFSTDGSFAITDQISIFGPTTGTTFWCKEFV